MSAKKPDSPLGKTDSKTRQRLGRKFLEEVVFGQMRQLQTWKTVTQQTSQFDSGYLAQQLTSILTGIPGTGMRGRGDDLSDGSEVKAANTVQATDTPRWNHSLDRKPKRTKINELLARPSVFYVLFDTKERDEDAPFRCRIWRVNPSTDKGYQKLVKNWAANRGKSTYNMQIQPPRWSVSNEAACLGTHIELPLFFHAEQKELGELDYVEILHFKTKPGSSKVITS